MSEQERKVEAQQRYRDKMPRPGERYRHYKGGEYEIVCASVMEDTLELLVTYRSLLLDYVWTRSFSNFYSLVPDPETGELMPRFQLLLPTQETT